MKDVLDDFGEDPVKLAQLLTGHRIKLAEDLSQYSFFPIIHIVSQHHSDHNLQQKLNDSDVLLDERSEEHTSELQSRPHISYAVFCLKKKKITTALK